MLVVIFLIVVAAIAGFGWLVPLRARRRMRRYDHNNQQRYLKTKRDRTISGWFRAGRQRRLTHQPSDLEN
jgi:hypothetical protein